MVSEKMQKEILTSLERMYPFDFQSDNNWKFFKGLSPQKGEYVCPVSKFGQLDMWFFPADEVEIKNEQSCYYVIIRKIDNMEEPKEYLKKHVCGPKHTVIEFKLNGNKKQEFDIFSNRLYLPYVSYVELDGIVETQDGPKRQLKFEKSINLKFYHAIISAIPEDCTVILSYGGCIYSVTGSFIRNNMKIQESSTNGIGKTVLLPIKELGDFIVAPF